MADLSTKKWVRYEPALAGNTELPEAERFHLEVRAGMSTLEWEAMKDGFLEAWRRMAAGEVSEAAAGAELAKCFEGQARLGSVPLTLDGLPVLTLAEYLQALAGVRASPLLRELFECLVWHNSYEGQRVLFSVRSFGGAVGTTSTKTEPATNQTAAH